MFGLEPSIAAIKALKVFKEKKITNILELGAGLGRDTVFFAQNNIHVHALDYSQSAIEIINKKKEELNLSNYIEAKVCDVRKKLSFKNEYFQGCFSHMLYCMALSNSDLKNINTEIYRVLKKRASNIFTVRHIEDGDYKKGIHSGQDLYENDGFIVHFFSKEKVKGLSLGFKNLNIENFEEGNFPRKLFFVENEKINK